MQESLKEIMRHLVIAENSGQLFVLSYIDSEPGLIPGRFDSYQDFYQDDGRNRFYRDHALISGNSEFLRFLSTIQKNYHTTLNYEFLSIMQHCLNTNDLFYFVVLFHCREPNRYNYDTIMPKYYLYPKDKTPFYLNDTIFHLYHYSYLNPDDEVFWSLTFLVSLLQRERNLISPRIQEFLSKLSLKDIIRLIKKARHQVIIDYETLAQRYSQSSPIKIPVGRGVLFLPQHFFRFKDHEIILSEILKSKIPTIFPINIENGFEQNISGIVHNFLMARDFDIRGQGVSLVEQCYFTTKGPVNAKEVHCYLGYPINRDIRIN